MRPCESSNALTFLYTDLMELPTFCRVYGPGIRSATAAAVPRLPNSLSSYSLPQSERSVRRRLPLRFAVISELLDSVCAALTYSHSTDESQLSHQRRELEQRADVIVYDRGLSSIINAYVCLKYTYDAHGQEQRSPPF